MIIITILLLLILPLAAAVAERRWMDEIMRPEYYAEKKQQAHAAIMRPAMLTNIMHGISGYGW